jgi:hypothetical protein
LPDRQRAITHPGWTEKNLIDAGYIRNVNTLGVVYYTNPEDADFDWIKSDTGEYWRQVPWHLVENPYVNTVDPGPTREVATAQPGREKTAAALGERIAAIYGEVLMGGDVFFERLLNNSYYVGYGLGHGELENVTHMYAPYQGFQKYDFSTGGSYWQWQFKNGAVNQTASSILATARGLILANTPIHPGLGYVAAAWGFDAQGMPDVPDPKFLVRGRKCYDPRLDAGFASTGVVTRNATTVVWTRNDALILADYMVNDWFGLGLGDLGLDWSSVSTAANYCDVVVATTSVTDVTISNGGTYGPGVTPTVTFSAPTSGVTATGTAIMQATDSTSATWYVAGISVTNPGSGYSAPPTVAFSGAGGATATTILGEKRHLMDIALRRGSTHKNNIETLRQHFRCSFTERQGRIAFVIDTTRAVTYTFTKDNAKAVNGSSRGTSKVPTASILTFTNPKRDWAQDKNYAYTDNCQKGVDEYRPAEWSLEGITRANEAARQNAYLLGKQRSNLGCQLELITSDGLQLEKGDRITVVFDILAMSGGVDFTIDTIKDNGNGRFLCDVSYYNPALFADTVGVVETTITLGKQDPYSNIVAPTGLVLTEVVDEFTPGNYTPKLRVSFTPASSPYYGGTKVTYQVNGGPVTVRGTFDQGPIDIAVPQGIGANVTVWLYTVNSLSNKPGTASLTGSFTMYNPNTPEAIGGITYDGAGGVYWSKPPVRTYPTIAAGSWTVNQASYTTANINNGVLTDTAITFFVGAAGYDPISQPGGAYVHFPNPAGATPRELVVTWKDSLAVKNEVTMRPMIYNGTTWVEPTNWRRIKVDNFTTIYYLGDLVAGGIFTLLAPYSSVPSSNVAAIAEIQPVVFSGTLYAYVKGYRITGLDLQGNLWQKDILYTPDATRPIKTEEWTQKNYRYYVEWDVTLLTDTHTLIQVQTISPTNDLSSIRQFETFSAMSPTGVPTAVQLGTGSTLTTSPSAGDNSTKIATTAFVQSESMQKVTAASGFSVGGGQNVSTRPVGQQLLIGSTTSTTYVTILSITGKGALRFLSAGSSTGNIRVTIDGVVIYNGTSITNAAGTYFGQSLIGSLVSTPDPSSAGRWNFDTVPGGDGFSFKSSLLIEAHGNTGSTIGVAYDYILY